MKIMYEQVDLPGGSPLKIKWDDFPHFTFPWHYHSEYEIVGMRGRISMLGGELTIVSAMGQGTRVELRIPRPPAVGGEQGQVNSSVLEGTRSGNQVAATEHMQ